MPSNQSSPNGLATSGICMADQLPRDRRASAARAHHKVRPQHRFPWLCRADAVHASDHRLLGRDALVHGLDIPIVAFALHKALFVDDDVAKLPNRCIGALKSNKPLLYHRRVRIIDVYMARIILEIIGVFDQLRRSRTRVLRDGLAVPPEDASQVVEGWALLGWFGAGLALTIGAFSERHEIVGKLRPPLARPTERSEDPAATYCSAGPRQPGPRSRAEPRASR